MPARKHNSWWQYFRGVFPPRKPEPTRDAITELQEEHIRAENKRIRERYDQDWQRFSRKLDEVYGRNVRQKRE